MRTKAFIAAWLLFSIMACKKKETTYSPNKELNNKPVGASANDLLTSNKYKALRIEINYMPGYEPDMDAYVHLSNRLNAFLNKVDISIISGEIPAASSTTLSIDQIRTIEEQNRTVYNTDTMIGVYLLYTNGNFTDDKVLGAAYRNTSMVLFGKKIHDNSGAVGQASRTKLEATVLEHEFGHLLGLVDLGSTMQTNHKDASHGNHCNNTDCLMYYAAETTDILGFLLTGNILPFDANCISDMHANGGK
jgi:hypothetical protein